jgi:hypothetical protein
VFYFPRPIAVWTPPILVKKLEAEITYRASFFDPTSGHEYPLGQVQGATEWRVPMAPLIQDWVLVLEQV